MPSKHIIQETNKTTLESSFFTRSPSHSTGRKSPYLLKRSQFVHNADRSPHIHGDDRGNVDISESKSRNKDSLLSIKEPSSLFSPSTKRSEALALVAAETKALLPGLLKTLPSAPPKGRLYRRQDLEYLDQEYCPHFTYDGRNRGTAIRVINGDSLDVAITLVHSLHPVEDQRPVCVLNMANAFHGGGGWIKGALAQEEALCYRSSLSFTLKRRFYPLPEISGIYSPSVVVVRGNIASGHELLDLSHPEALPVVSVVSVAAMRDPPLTSDREQYGRREDREMMKRKMRMVLRIATFNRHRRLVLGALGCGAFNHPNKEVVKCWKEVFEEVEFGQGWWETVIFAVLDNAVGSGIGWHGNYGVFYRGLEGLVV